MHTNPSRPAHNSVPHLRHSPRFNAAVRISHPPSFFHLPAARPVMRASVEVGAGGRNFDGAACRHRCRAAAASHPALLPLMNVIDSPCRLSSSVAPTVIPGGITACRSSARILETCEWASCSGLWTSTATDSFCRTFSPKTSTETQQHRLEGLPCAFRHVRASSVVRRCRVQFTCSSGMARLYSLVRRDSQPSGWKPVAVRIISGRWVKQIQNMFQHPSTRSFVSGTRKSRQTGLHRPFRGRTRPCPLSSR